MFKIDFYFGKKSERKLLKKKNFVFKWTRAKKWLNIKKKKTKNEMCKPPVGIIQVHI